MKVSVIVHPNAKKPRVEKDLLGVLHVHVTEPPLDGRANKAVIQALAQNFKIAPSRVVLLQGNKSKNKVFEIG